MLPGMKVARRAPDRRPLGVVAGNAFTCALLRDGVVRCWGSNGFGVLGDGSMVPQSSRPVAARVSGEVVDLFAGGSHLCVRTG